VDCFLGWCLWKDVKDLVGWVEFRGGINRAQKNGLVFVGRNCGVEDAPENKLISCDIVKARSLLGLDELLEP